MNSGDLSSSMARGLADRVSANEDRFTEAAACSIEEAERHVQVMLDPPPEFACRPAALIGLRTSLSDLAEVLPGTEGLCRLIGPAVAEAGPLDLVAMAAEVVADFIRRKGHHLQYLSALHLGLQSGSVSPRDRELNLPLSQMYGAWAVRRELDSWKPTKHAQARVLSALARPYSRSSLGWTVEQRQRAAGNAIYELRVAIGKNPTAALAMGLASIGYVGDPEVTGIEAFNSRFRKRMTDLLEYKSADGQAGAGGNGTLSVAGLRRAGRELLSAAKAGRHEEIHVCIEIVSHLTSEHVQLLPVQLKSSPPPGALAWLDVPKGSYFHTLFKLAEKGARPDLMTEELYELTTQIVQVHFSAPLADALRRAAEHFSGEFCSVRELLGDVAHGPHHAVAGEGPYRVTASKVQASLPALMLQRGEYRWSVAVATSSPFVVSRGRPAYGVGRQTKVDEVIDHAHDLLGWPRSGHKREATTLVGSFTTPKLLAVRIAFSALAHEADSWTVAADAVEDVVNCVNAHAAYLAMLFALCYALRNRVVYKLPTQGLRTGIALKFNDKDVHEFSMPSVPTLPLVREAVYAWEELLRGAVSALRRIASEDAIALADSLQARLGDHETVGWVFTISVAHTLEPVGAKTWRNRLPRRLRLVANFGRQFWPHRLADLDVSQLDTDILLRHQMPALHPGSSHVCRPEEEIQARLLHAMTQVVERQLDLPVPRALGVQASS